MREADADFYKQATLPGGPIEINASLPQRIGPYKIESLLSQGGMSLLYLGINPETNRPIAIKVLLPKFLTNQEIVSRFLKEAEIIKKANHPNIVKLYDHGQWEKGLYIAMEFIQGVSLSQFIQKRSLSLHRALEIVLQVAYALAHLHSHGIIHRDLKPENILIDESGDVKVIDFGIAQMKEDKDSKNALMGTPVYMSPEQKENISHVSPASDLYSLGVITYELVLGRLSHGAIHLNLLPKQLCPIVEKALENDPAKRYSNALDFINDVSQCLQILGEEEERSSEMVDLIYKSGEFLIQKKIALWPSLEYGLDWQEGEMISGLYLELFPITETSIAIVIADPIETGPSSFLYSSFFKGAAEMAFSSLSDCRPISIFTTLNRLLISKACPVSASMLYLDFSQDSLTFMSCKGLELHLLAEGSRQERVLSTPNPTLGSQPNPDFTEAIDHWRAGDTIHLTTQQLPQEAPSGSVLIRSEELGDWVLLSSQHQAERLLRRSANVFKRTALALVLRRVF